MRVLVSVRSVAEALDAAGAGADLVDLKEPARGALGGLPPSTIAHIVGAVRAAHPALRLSATIGDVVASSIDAILLRVRTVADCGVDDVKVGVVPGPGATRLLDALARCGASVVPVLIADDGIDAGLLETVLAGGAFAAVMLDTADKRAGSLLQRVPALQLRDFVVRVQGTGRLAGLAGALRAADVPELHRLAPDFAGFRSAVCVDGRTGHLEAPRVRALCAALRPAIPA
jgi:uncharacterized protein (UPF0264 family)